VLVTYSNLKLEERNTPPSLHDGEHLLPDDNSHVLVIRSGRSHAVRSLEITLVSPLYTRLFGTCRVTVETDALQIRHTSPEPRGLESLLYPRNDAALGQVSMRVPQKK